VTAFLPLITSAVAGLVQERPVSPSFSGRFHHPSDPSSSANVNAHPIAENGDASIVDSNGDLLRSEQQTEASSLSREHEKAGTLELKNGKQGPDSLAERAGQIGIIESSKEQLLYLWEVIREPTILLPTLFIFFWQATPQSDTAMFYFT
jgi:hypothetical protein